MPRRHTVRQGDGASKLAYENGHFVDTVWDDPDNAELREQRENKDVLLPGDVVVIPDLREKTEDKPDAQRHRFRRRGVPSVFKLQLFDQDEPRSNQNYTLAVDGRTRSGTTDADGVLEETVPPDARRGLLVIGPDAYEMTVLFGHLDPIEEIAGVQKRLANLGYDCPDDDGELNDRTREAIRSFQRRFDLEKTGEPDQPFLDKLEEVHETANDMPEDADED